MREIKFRAWDKVYNHFHDGDIVNDYILGEFIADQEYIVTQYTGLKDKNGKDIYEGDIIRVHEGNDFSWGAKIKYESGGYWLDDENCLGAVHTFSEIIGNIYENPELLKEE